MRNHTKVYLKYFGYTIADFIPCECCGAKAVDVHHLENRGIGGSKEKDVPANLMALCRECHIKYGDKKEQMQFLKDKHFGVLAKKLGFL